MKELRHRSLHSVAKMAGWDYLLKTRGVCAAFTVTSGQRRILWNYWDITAMRHNDLCLIAAMSAVAGWTDE